MNNHSDKYYQDKYSKYKKKYFELKGGILLKEQELLLKKNYISDEEIVILTKEKSIYTSKDIDDIINRKANIQCSIKTQKIVDCNNNIYFKNMIGTCWMLSIFMILIVGDSTRECLQNMLIHDIDYITDNEVLSIFLPKYFYNSDGSLLLEKKKEILELISYLKIKFIVNIDNQEIFLESKKDIKELYLYLDDKCELELAKIYKKIFNTHFTSAGGTLYSNFLLINLLTSLFLKKLIKLNNIVPTKILYNDIFNYNIGILIHSAGHITSFYLCNDKPKYCNNESIINYEWRLFFKKILQLNILNIIFKLYIDDNRGPYIYEVVSKNKWFFNLNGNKDEESNIDEPIEIIQFIILNLLNDYKNFKLDNIIYYIELIISNNYLDYLNEILLNKQIDINIKDLYGYTLLTLAIKKNKIQIVELLLLHNADPNLLDNNGYTPLLFAIKENNIEIIKLLLLHNADPNLESSKSTPLLLAIDNIEIVKLLIMNKVKLDKDIILYIDKILDKDITKQNIKELILTNMPDKYGYTPLTYAVENNEIETVKLLLTKQACIDLLDNNGNTALFIAITLGNIEMIKLLLNNGANPNILYNNGNTVLDFVYLLKYTNLSKCIDILKLLLLSDVCPIDPNVINPSDGLTILIRAIISEEIQIVELLLKNKKLNINLPDSKGKLPLDYAIKIKNEHIITLLYQNGAIAKVIY
jgi:ankyrin repeat protein